MNRLVTILLLTVISCGTMITTASVQTKRVTQINTLIQEVHHRQLVMDIARTPVSGTFRHSQSPSYKFWVLRHWKKQLKVTLRQFHNPPRLSQWLCIHRGEGSWSANTGNSYYGGLQMDMSFQSSYGRHLLSEKGTANN